MFLKTQNYVFFPNLCFCSKFITAQLKINILYRKANNLIFDVHMHCEIITTTKMIHLFIMLQLPFHVCVCAVEILKISFLGQFQKYCIDYC